jgi:hypothetical protein
MSLSLRRSIDRAFLFAFSALACFAASVPDVRATTTFAQFSERSVAGSVFPPGDLFGYYDVATKSAEFGTYLNTGVGDPIPANFTFLNLAALVGLPVPADLQGIQDATMTMTSSTTAPVVTGFGGTVGSQLINGGGQLQNVIHFTRDTAAAEGSGSRTNLLTVTFTAQLSGTLGGQTAALTADDRAGYTINYSSDFLTFPSKPEANFALAFSSWVYAPFTQFVGPQPLTIDEATQNFFSSPAAGAGTFAGGVLGLSIPEPNSFALALAGLPILGLVRRMGRRPPRPMC